MRCDRLSGSARGIDYVSTNYFETVGMGIVSGRGFTPDDREGAPRVAVVNETLARSAFGQRGIIGRQITLNTPDVKDAPFSVVGVVRDSKFNDLREAAVRPMIWVPLRQARRRLRRSPCGPSQGLRTRLYRRCVTTSHRPIPRTWCGASSR